MKKKLFIFISYLLVAATAAAATVLVLRREGSGKLAELETLIVTRFIGEADRDQMEDAAAAAMVSALDDRWSYYIPARDYAAYQEQMENAYVGVGITIVQQDDGFLITAVHEGGPAGQAGILPGDILVEAEDQSVVGLSVTEVRNRVTGPEGTQVTIGIMRSGEKRSFMLSRQKLETPVAVAKMVTEDIGLVTISNFDSRCADESIAAIETLRSQGARKLIFDVRNNPGGYAAELVKLLDYLLPEGDLFRTVDYLGREHTDKSDASCLDIPMAVLVNGESYSAAEFFGAAMMDYGAAVVVGEQTCGKGYFQYTYQLSDGSAVGLSVGKYFTPRGVSLAGVGITPDIQVPVDKETALGIYAGILEPEKDPQLQAAIEALNR